MLKALQYIYVIMGIIYLIQPAELVGTNRYKVGCSSKSTLDRVRTGYRKGSRYLHICECEKYLEIETIIKKVFNIKFRLIAGTEYFEGNENNMRKCFMNEFQKYHRYIKLEKNKDIKYNVDKQIIKNCLDYKLKKIILETKNDDIKKKLNKCLLEKKKHIKN